MADALLTSPLPADVGQAIRTVKAQLRGQIGDVAAVFAGAEEAMRAEATAVAADREAGRPVWPVVQFRDIAAGTVPAGAVEAIRRRGCVVVQDTFPRRRAEDWDAELASYAERNRLAEIYRAIDDGVFAGRQLIKTIRARQQQPLWRPRLPTDLRRLAQFRVSRHGH